MNKNRRPIICRAWVDQCCSNMRIAVRAYQGVFGYEAVSFWSKDMTADVAEQAWGMAYINAMSGLQRSQDLK